MNKQLHLFLTAVMYYTRLPVWKGISYSEQDLTRATLYFPFIGWITASMTTGVFFLSNLLYTPAISLILTMLAGILLTGALHEDGFADVCDGFGGGWTKAKILEIMKDSQVGVYGVIGLMALLGLKYTSFYQLIEHINTAYTRTAYTISHTVFITYHLFFIFLIAHSLSRFVTITLIYTHSYARDSTDSKARPVDKSITVSGLLKAGTGVIIPLLTYSYFQHNLSILLVFIPLAIVRKWAGVYFQKWIGGYTGDCLGALQQLSEMTIYLFFISPLWKFY